MQADVHRGLAKFDALIQAAERGSCDQSSF